MGGKRKRTPELILKHVEIIRTHLDNLRKSEESALFHADEPYEEKLKQNEAIKKRFDRLRSACDKIEDDVVPSQDVPSDTAETA